MATTEKDIVDDHSQMVSVDVPSEGQIPNLKKHIGIRSLVAFWLLGLCNNYGYVVMLSAAHDILSHNYSPNNTNETTPGIMTTIQPVIQPDRDCNKLSTGAILLADIIPSLLIKIIAPFFPLCIHVRLALVILLSISGYILVGASVAPWMAICGVVSTALASGLGEASLLSYMAFYKDKDVISTWSSGTGGAGFFGSLSYAFLTSIGISPAMTLYGLSSIPVLMAFSFWFILKHPKLNEDRLFCTDTNSLPGCSSTEQKECEEVPLHTTNDSFIEKLMYIPQLLRFMIPIGLVYFFEYFINQGLFELVYFRNVRLSHSEQYRWYQVLYQIGVFFSRSSIRLIKINHLWLLSVLQLFNVVLFTLQAVYEIIPNMYVIMAVVLWEGLLGGAAYVNTYHKISIEVPPSKREFSMAITSLADALGITGAGIFAFPAHNFICDLPLY
ncbi:CLN3 lysosomal/endosomal transmembrane protein, battenin isoform X2 [Lycorma delicatula]